MADTNAIAKTPSAAEPRADYAIQVEPTTTPTSTTMASRSYVARVYRTDPDGQKFDEHGIRIGRWEVQPCGKDFVPNILMAWCLPCITSAQISHRMGGSYSTMLVLSGGSIVAMFFALALMLPNKEYVYHYTTSLGRKRLRKIDGDDEGLGLSFIFGMIILIVSAFVHFMTGIYLRSTVRARYQIPSACCGDFCCMVNCACCALTAMATHIKSYKPRSCDFGPSADQLPGYDVEPIKQCYTQHPTACEEC